jgi:hypothetical protein
VEFIFVVLEDCQAKIWHGIIHQRALSAQSDFHEAGPTSDRLTLRKTITKSVVATLRIEND